VTYHLDDTIAAIASAPGGAARGIVRVSGPAVPAIVERVFQADPEHRAGSMQRAAAVDGAILIRLEAAERPVPGTLFLWPDRRSYTREPVAEFHTLGSPPIVQAVLDAVCRAGARLAEPGEFTLRAFVAGRIDLTQAEAVLGVIDAHDAHDLRSAVEQLAGNLAKPLGQLREELLMLLAEVEAGLDFVEEDIEFIAAEELSQRLGKISMQLAEIESSMASRSTANASSQVALVGAPNAGKSSLFNALVSRFGVGSRQSTAIVSDIRGTTRDYLVAEVELAGQCVQLIDTAGIDDLEEQLAELDAIARARAAIQHQASLVRIVCVDAGALDVVQEMSRASSRTELIAITKSDVAAAPPIDGSSMRVVVTSSKSRSGLAELAAAVSDLLASTCTSTRVSCVAATAARCRESLRKASEAVDRATVLVGRGVGDELVAAELRTALEELGKVVGAVYTDDLLDRIFKSFCIGK